MSCGYRREEGHDKKAEVARGGWAEDARRPPATSLVSALIPLLRATWGRGAAFETSAAKECWQGHLGQRPVRALRTTFREVWRVLLAVRVPAQRCL